MSKLTKQQQIDVLQKCLRTQGAKLRDLETRIKTQEDWVDHADDMLTELNHALPDPEYDARCEENAVAAEESLARHAVRLGLVKPKLKQLDQSVFDGQDENWRWAAKDARNCVVTFFEEKPKKSRFYDFFTNEYGDFFDSDISCTPDDWQNSLIERKELTGSDLALELLKNQRYIIASVSDKSDADAIECGNNKLIHKSSEDIFTDDMGGIYCWAVALNNQGEPLTAADVGL